MPGAYESNNADSTVPSAESARPLVVGLLGGVASGKSLVASQLQELGAGLLDADQAGHAALRLPEVLEAIRTRWGEKVFDATGEVDRKAVASIVFARTASAADELRFLEGVTHPAIGQILLRQLADLSADGKWVVVLDAPVMLKAGWDRMCDHILFVDAPRDVRLARAKSRGWSETDFDDREAAQESLSAKRQRADTEIDNSQSASTTREQVARWWAKMAN